MSQVLTDQAADFAEEPIARNERFRFSDPLAEQRYQAAMQADARRPNRFVLCILAILVDLFVIPELRDAPDFVTNSIIIRFFILTPLILLFIYIDIKDYINRYYKYIVVIVYILPTFLICIESLNAKSIQDVANMQSIPFILISVIAGRLSIRQTVVVSTASFLIYTLTILNCKVISPVYFASIILTSLSIGVGAVAVSIRLDLRERTVFLLHSRAERRNQLLSTLVRTDPLTGVANRRSFDETLAWGWSEAWSNKAWIGLIMIDVDHFKAFNDHYGHQEGDVCLRTVAQAIQTAVRSGDMVARYGGEEFAVILADSNLAQVQNVAERIVQEVRALRRPHLGLGPGAFLSVSLGAASLTPQEEQGSERLVQLADRLLYAAKDGGRDRVVCG